MVATLRHRGPDDKGTFCNGAAALGAARLSIIDVAGGHQPISVDGGAITVVQNGEIYNYVELRDELQRNGRQFTTACDTEVIAHLYATEGVSGFQKMRGMFAVAVWDEARQRLVLARDRVGKKPLYYLQKNGELLFGSETKAILAALPDVPGVNAGALLSFFTFGYVSGSQAAFDGMQRLAPGAALIVDRRAGSARTETFWRWPEPPDRDAMPEGEAIERLRAELAEAVRIRMRSDVPLGAFLSGGMDSAAVLALMASHSTQPIKTFTIGFGDPAYDEVDEARSTAAHFNADHHEQIVAPDAIRVAETLAVHYDEPFADASAIPTFHVAELARRHVTVCLTGDGGDELFAGYTPYADALLRVASPPITALRSAFNAGARYVPVHARGKGRLSTMALGPEAWFVWRRTVFPDYLLESVVEPDLWRAGGPMPERQAVADIRARRRPAAVAPAAMGSAALSSRRHPGESRPRHDGALARGAVSDSRSPRRRARGHAVCRPARRRRDAQAAVSRSDQAVGTGAGPGPAEARLRRAAAPMVSRTDDRLGARDPSRYAKLPARLDPHQRGVGAAAAARKRIARSRQAYLGAGLSRALGENPSGSPAHPRARMRVTMLVRCLAMMRGGGETRHLAWARELAALGVDVDIIAGVPLVSGAARYPVEGSTSG